MEMEECVHYVGPGYVSNWGIQSTSIRRRHQTSEAPPLTVVPGYRKFLKGGTWAEAEMKRRRVGKERCYETEFETKGSMKRRIQLMKNKYGKVMGSDMYPAVFCYGVHQRSSFSSLQHNRTVFVEFCHWNRNDEGKKMPVEAFVLHNQYWSYGNDMLSECKTHLDIPTVKSLIRVLESFSTFVFGQNLIGCGTIL
ncbi:hypothetical protein RJT34_14631 [Clitoria ternatea]|uniref:Uncharacterized protein n=1 Tax=Clitoria ternatea TaxID=43366 RepID=A0AAN9JT81_CLITE